jgi:hypothetical protein
MAENDASNPAVAAGDDPLVGTLVAGRYRVVRKLGEGGMGTVYLATHEALRKPVALKVLSGRGSADKETVARFEREAVAAANLRHPNIAEATDFGRLPDGAFYLAMEYVEGKTLRALLAASPAGLAPARAIAILRQIAAALARAHAADVVHRDLKPENVIVFDGPAAKDSVKVIDFGIARIQSATFGGPGAALTLAGAVFGTPEYMAPEQVLGQPVDARADQYAFGVTAFELLTGRVPFTGEEMGQILMKHVNAPIPRASDTARHLPGAASATLEKVLAKRPGDRFPDIEQACKALEAALSAPASGGGTLMIDPSAPRPPMASAPALHMATGPVTPLAPATPAALHVTGSIQSPGAEPARAVPAVTGPVPAVTGPVPPVPTLLARGPEKKPLVLIAALTGASILVFAVAFVIWRVTASSLPDGVDGAIDKWEGGAYDDAEPALRDGLNKQPALATDKALYEPLIGTIDDDKARTVLLRLLNTTALGRSAPMLSTLAGIGVEAPSPRRNGALRLLHGRLEHLSSREQRARIALRDADDCAGLEKAVSDLAGAGSAAEADAKAYREGQCRKLLRREELCGCPPPGSSKGRGKKAR